ncbi:MAG TPA: cytochrome c biogenesis protein ResB [Myxococcales bacterium]|nr:cytochrome c biogenesis protein ResB [Myxococcales bacterium]
MSEALVEAGPPPGAVSEIAQLPPQESHAAVEQVFRFFCSLRLTLANLLLLFLGMIAGTFVNPQNDSLSNIERAFAHRPWVLGAYRSFELYDLFHSWWFTLLLLSLALNLIACSIERLPRIWYLVRYPETRLDHVVGLRFRTAPSEASFSAAEIAERLRARKYCVRAAEGGLFAEKGRYARFGVWLVHLSLLLILGGGIVGRLTAFEGVANVPQAGGQADAFLERRPDGGQFRHKLVDAEGRPFLVQCDDFRLKEFEPGRPKAFESDLRLFRKLPDGSAGPELARQTIAVNHPLRYAGLTFYQASYSQLEEGMRARVKLLDKATGAHVDRVLAAGEPIEAAEGLSYQLVAYQEDYSGQGPAVQVVRTEEPPGSRPAAGPDGRPQPSNDAKVKSFWVFARKPDFDRDNRDDRFAFRFDGLTTLYATGLQIARDPSTPVVYAGCFLLFFGIGVAFYTSHKRIWAQVRDGKLALGGAAHRNAEAFGREFDELCRTLGVLGRGDERAAA